MAKNLGQVAAVSVGLTPPTNKNLIWVQVDANGTTANIWRFDAAAAKWVILQSKGVEQLNVDSPVTISAAYNNTIVRCYDGCTDVDLGPDIDDIQFEMLNDTASTINVSNVRIGVSSFDPGDLLLVRCVKNVGWVAKVV